MLDNSDYFKKEEYINRVNRVIDYIDENIDQDLTLAALSRVANFSEYHFHRIFKSITREPLNRYIQRVRIEKAAAQLIFNPRKKITDIAFDSGFSSSQFFSRVFKQYFDISASEWRYIKSTEDQEIKPLKKIIMADKVIYSTSHYNYQKTPHPPGLLQPVKVMDLPDMRAAYVRQIGVYSEYSELFSMMLTKLSGWGRSQGLYDSGTRIIAVFRDHPVITDKNNLKMTLCITIPGKVNTTGEIGTCKIQGGKYAVGRFELSEYELESAWKFMYCEWLPKSGYQQGDSHPVEFFLSHPDKHPFKKFIVDICIPVKLL